MRFLTNLNLPQKTQLISHVSPRRGLLPMLITCYNSPGLWEDIAIDGGLLSYWRVTRDFQEDGMSMSAPCQQQTNVSRSAAHRDDAIHILSSVNTIHCLHNNDHQTMPSNTIKIQDRFFSLSNTLFWSNLYLNNSNCLKLVTGKINYIFGSTQPHKMIW